MGQFAAFILFNVGWGLAGWLALSLNVHPIAIGTVWLVGYLWGVGYIVDGHKAADLLLKRWLQMLAGFTVVALILSTALS